MDRDTEKYYEDLFTMFSTKGWGHLMKELRDALELIEKTAIYESDTKESFEVSKGRAISLKLLLGYETLMRQAFDGMQKETDDADL